MPRRRINQAREESKKQEPAVVLSDMALEMAHEIDARAEYSPKNQSYLNKLWCIAAFIPCQIYELFTVCLRAREAKLFEKEQQLEQREAKLLERAKQLLEKSKQQEKRTSDLDMRERSIENEVQTKFNQFVLEFNRSHQDLISEIEQLKIDRSHLAQKNHSLQNDIAQKNASIDELNQQIQERVSSQVFLDGLPAMAATLPTMLDFIKESEKRNQQERAEDRKERSTQMDRVFKHLSESNSRHDKAIQSMCKDVAQRESRLLNGFNSTLTLFSNTTQQALTAVTQNQEKTLEAVQEIANQSSQPRVVYRDNRRLYQDRRSFLQLGME